MSNSERKDLLLTLRCIVHSRLLIMSITKYSCLQQGTIGKTRLFLGEQVKIDKSSYLRKSIHWAHSWVLSNNPHHYRQGTIGFDGTILENDQSWLITMATLTNIPRRYFHQLFHLFYSILQSNRNCPSEAT